MKTRLLVVAFSLFGLSSNFELYAQNREDSTSTRLPGAIQILREGDENPMLTIGKSTFYGMLTGSLLAGAISLAVEGDTQEMSKWLVVGGTFVGFGVGIHHVATRPKPYAASLLQFDSGGLAKLTLPPPQLHWQNGRVSGASINVVSLSL